MTLHPIPLKFLIHEEILFLFFIGVTFQNSASASLFIRQYPEALENGHRHIL